jgi:excisionase family DNA binding protein
MTTNEPLLTEGEAASLLRVSLTSVRRWRREGRGPVFRKLGRSVRYRRDDLTDFVVSARRMSTGAAGASLSNPNNRKGRP